MESHIERWRGGVRVACWARVEVGVVPNGPDDFFFRLARLPLRYTLAEPRV